MSSQQDVFRKFYAFSTIQDYKAALQRSKARFEKQKVILVGNHEAFQSNLKPALDAWPWCDKETGLPLHSPLLHDSEFCGGRIFCTLGSFSRFVFGRRAKDNRISLQALKDLVNKTENKTLGGKAKKLIRKIVRNTVVLCKAKDSSLLRTAMNQLFEMKGEADKAYGEIKHSERMHQLDLDKIDNWLFIHDQATQLLSELEAVGVSQVILLKGCGAEAVLQNQEPKNYERFVVALDVALKELSVTAQTERKKDFRRAKDGDERLAALLHFSDAHRPENQAASHFTDEPPTYH